jgi:hypothetical protein
MPASGRITHMKPPQRIALRNVILAERGGIMCNIQPVKNAVWGDPAIIGNFFATKPAFTIIENI